MPNTQNNKKKKATVTDQLFEALNSESMINNANKVLNAAVNVLEEEIAAGILAAKKIESKVIDVEGIREDPQDLMNRIRRDVHEAVDLLMDSFTAISRQLGVLNQNFTKTANSESETKPTKKTSEIPIVRNLKPGIPGETIVLKLSFTSQETENATIINFQKADLNGPLAMKILQRNISLKPSTLKLNPGDEKEIEIQIKIPQKIVPGHYSGLFVDANDCTNKAIVLIDVK